MNNFVKIKELNDLKRIQVMDNLRRAHQRNDGTHYAHHPELYVVDYIKSLPNLGTAGGYYIKILRNRQERVLFDPSDEKVMIQFWDTSIGTWVTTNSYTEGEVG